MCDDGDDDDDVDVDDNDVKVRDGGKAETKPSEPTWQVMSWRFR